ncbi:tyrosine-type recombinase/integrase [Halomonas shantousis]
MARTRLTAAAVSKLPPPDSGRKEVYDAEVPGLTLRITASGVRSWSFTYRKNNKSRRLTLGQYPGVSLKLARERARDARASVQRGEDPVEDKKEKERERTRNGFDACARDFVEKYCKPNLKTWKKIDSCFERFAIPAFGDRPVKEIRRRDIVDLLDKVAAKTPGQAHHLRAFLSKMFKWLLEREIVEVNPVVGTAPRHKAQPRSRVLSEAEIVALWKATERLGGPFGACTRVLLLTGVRRDEASYLRWDELDGDFAKLPASRMKGGRDFKVPLSATAKDIVASMPALGDYVFTTNGRSPISGWSKAKTRLDEYMGEELGESVPDWRLHDLRRTLASGLAMLGVRSEVIKRALGHAASANDVTAVHYLWHNYDTEALEAVQVWAGHIEKITSSNI